MGTRWIAALIALLLVLAGCSASSGGDSYAPAEGDAAADLDGALQYADDGGGREAGVAAEPAAEPVGDVAAAPGAGASEAQMMVRRVELTVLVDDVAAAATRARATVTGAGGWVQSEEITPATEERPGRGSMVLRVPSSDLDGIVDSFGELGTVTSSRSSAEDVTAEYRDVEARVATLEAGAERLRTLIADAPSVEAITALERELSSREADLDALKARMQVLEADVSRSTITLHLGEEADDLEGLEVDRTGFVAGLRSGWEAFASSVTMVLTAAGALLPFLALAALIVIPVLWWRRRRTGRAVARQDRAATPGLASKNERSEVATGDPDGPGGR